MKKILFMFLFLSSLIYAQLSTNKYLVVSDTILTFTSQYKNLEIVIVDSATVDTVVLEKETISGEWANISVLSNVTGAIVVSMIPGAGLGGAFYFLEKFGDGSFRLRMTDTAADASEKSVKVRVTGRP